MDENKRKIDYKMYSIRPYFGPMTSWEIEERELKSYRYMLAVPAPLSKEQEETILKMIWEQFKEMYPNTQEFTNKVLTNIECPKCGKNLFQRTDIVLTSYPAQYQYECECGLLDMLVHDGIEGR